MAYKSFLGFGKILSFRSSPDLLLSYLAVPNMLVSFSLSLTHITSTIVFNLLLVCLALKVSRTFDDLYIYEKVIDKFYLFITVGTPKYVANKMKSKGLQRLRWYCQVCEKQCRDENGFKCHAASESHLRQMLVVGEHAGSHIAGFSNQFQSEFVSLLSRRQVYIYIGNVAFCKVSFFC